jgi:hypothetical protein
MTDFRRIRISPSYRRLDPGYIVDLHRISRRWLAERLLEQTNVPTVVVTHHAPHPLSLEPGGMADPLCAGYASDCSGLMANQVRLWIHGHVHSVSDYRVGDTRVVCNPRGYWPNWLVPGFRADLVVEV